jgi:hypothetical protein
MNLTIRQKAIYWFLIVVLVVVVATLIALYEDVYSYFGFIFVGLTLAVILISLIPFAISLDLFKAYLANPEQNASMKYFGLVSYFICLLINIWVVYVHLSAANNVDPWPLG